MVAFKRVVVFVFLLVCVATVARAQTDDDKGAYVGGSFGAAEAGFSESDIDLSDFSVDTLGVDTSDTGYKIWGGYNFNKWIAIEGGYAVLGSFRVDLFQNPGNPQMFSPGPVQIDVEPTTLFLDVAGYLPLGRMFALFAKLGVHRWTVDVTSFDTNTLLRTDSRDWGATGGAGVEIRLKTGLAFRAEWERFDGIVDKHVDLGSVGLMYRW